MQRISAQEGKQLVETLSKVAESKMSAADKQAMESLLSRKLDDDFYMMKKNNCPNCNKEISFYDMVKTAMDDNVHDKAFFDHLFSGQETIVRTSSDADKQVRCSSCGTDFEVMGGYICGIYAMF